jgi:putative phosphoribosyl transferase
MSLSRSTCSRDSLFASREDAGRRLAAALRSRADGHAALLLALSHNAVAVTRVLARSLELPMDVSLVRRLKLPGGMIVGAVARGVLLVNDGIVRRMRLESGLVEQLASQASLEVAREEAELRAGRPSEGVAGRIAILIDDGLGDPGEWVAAARALRRQGADGVWLAAPTLADASRTLVAGAVDEIITAVQAQPDGWRYGEDSPVDAA